ncbi:MAG: 2-oxoacid:acceptor oxidoreductase family protein [Kiritimatiellia bacterium]|nr:2-oxoacid:acceptor oxidoreductase family protein [Lentisphaerota bacterium]
MLERIIIAGAGGQGSVLLGKLMALTAMDIFPHITFFPAYGAEVRGGASHCQVVMSSTEIASPCAEQADALILMNQHDAAGFVAQLAPKGLAVVNSSLCHIRQVPRGRRLVSIPASAMADQLGSPRSANIVMLGALLRHKPLFSMAAAEQTIRKLPSGAPGMLEINLRALQAGHQAAG